MIDLEAPAAVAVNAEEPTLWNTGLWARHILQRSGATLASFTASLLFLTSGPAIAEQTIVRFPASPDPKVFAAQQTLVEAWSIIEDAYVDAQFGGHQWEDELSNALVATYAAEDGDGAYKQIGNMLSKLGDPFTRIVPASEYANFRVSSDGEVQGVGLLIAADPTSGKLVVLAPIQGGPADRAGIQPGDEVLQIDGNTTEGWDGDRAAKLLRGTSGSSVMVKFARRSEQVPGVAGRPELPPKIELKQVNLKREKLELSPVYSTAVDHDGHKLGYIRLVNFGQHAALDMQHAVQKLQGTGAEGFILDLRNNPGGLVRSGLDIARLWMDGEAAIFNVQGREDNGHIAIMQRVILEQGLAATDLPLAVLVNGGSASASEILAGALHDNGRATLIGEKTFGKGKIQSVFELADGSALFVTVAKYRTPNMEDIDQVGIQPDTACSLGDAGRQAAAGVPLNRKTAESVLSQLQEDSCVLTAEALLESQLAHT
ncbi:g13081 [Coccomyxa viridis]|uniref:G13081 protein n=1 Tax=Coccomyxa viridis TaxID=1274662 RepID=A0ABP1GJ25_9CHLO